MKSAGLSMRQDGYTVLELVVIIFVVGLISAVAIVRFTASSNAAIASAAQSIISDISYGQEMAKVNNRGVEVTFHSSVNPPRPPGRRCFIATACYGPNAEQTLTYVRLRDQVLLQSRSGARFINWYYENGPGLAQIADGVPMLKSAARVILAAPALLLAPIVSDAHAGGRIGGGINRRGEPNTYYLSFMDGEMLKNPQGGGDYIVELEETVAITSTSRTVQFDGSGKANLLGYFWGNNETSAIVCSLNNLVHIYIARHSGKVWIVR